jgi:hypothetical protein
MDHSMNEPDSTSLMREITMAIDTHEDKRIPSDTDAHAEAVASQEEMYLEETEEEVRAILTSDGQVQSRIEAEFWRRKIEKLEFDWK